MTKLSRTKIELLTECPRCFWLDVKQGVKRPPSFPYTINNAVDYLLKQEFDVHREAGTRHPIMEAHGVDAVPFAHPNLNTWRHNFTGVQYQHEPSGFLVTGAVDDVWVNPAGELHVVDYKATGANQHQIHDSYQRQMEIYQWLLRQNGFKVSPTGYFVFARVNKGDGFASPAVASREGGERGGVLPFDIFVESYTGDDAWIPGALATARATYDSDEMPAASESCQYCAYRESASRFEG
jgi:hypothetical protein